MVLSVTLTVGGVDMASYTRIQSIRLTESLRDRAGTLTGLQMIIPYIGSTPAVAIPRIGKQLVLTVAGTIEFGGIVQRVEETPAGSNSYLYTVDCSDYTRWFDRYMVQGVQYPVGDAGTTGTAKAIIQSIVTNWANNGPIGVVWDTTLVETGPTIPQQTFDFETPSSAIDRVAKVSGDYVWYVDHNKQVNFRASNASSGVAPVTAVTWESGTTVFDLKISEAGDQIVNVAYIKDAKAVQVNQDTGAAQPFTDQHVADGYGSFFPLAYEPASYNGTTVTVTPTTGSPTTYTVANGGLLKENIDGTPGDGQTRDKALLCLPNWGIRLETPPPAGARVVIAYDYLDIGPAVWRIPDAVSISEVVGREGAANSDGIYEEVFSATDLEGVSKDAIQARAELYLFQRRRKWIASCGAYGTGWHAGQYLDITSSRRFGGVFASGVRFFVTDVAKRFATPDQWINEISLSSDVFGEQ